MRLFATSLICFACLFTSAQADLSPSEQAAQSQRPATAEEQRLRKSGCTLEPQANLGTLQVQPGLAFKQVKLPGFQVLALLFLTQAAPGGKQSIDAFKPLPNGGIAGKDFCGAIQLTTPKSKSGVLRTMALRLRSNMDVMALYPNTAKTAQSRGMLEHIPAGRYIQVKETGNRRTQWLEEQSETWNGRDYSRPGFSLGNISYIPVLETR